MIKLIRNSIILLTLIFSVFYLWDYLTPGLPLNFEECIERGGFAKKVVTEEGVINDLDQCVFAAKNSKQERICKKLGGESRIGGRCPCCEMTYPK